MELLEECKELITVPVYVKDNNRGGRNYTGITLLPINDEILSSILLSRLTPYTEEIIGVHQGRF